MKWLIRLCEQYDTVAILLAAVAVFLEICVLVLLW